MADFSANFWHHWFKDFSFSRNQPHLSNPPISRHVKEEPTDGGNNRSSGRKRKRVSGAPAGIKLVGKKRWDINKFNLTQTFVSNEHSQQSAPSPNIQTLASVLKQMANTQMPKRARAEEAAADNGKKKSSNNNSSKGNSSSNNNSNNNNSSKNIGRQRQQKGESEIDRMLRYQS